jgi:hypothetical protein
MTVSQTGEPAKAVQPARVRNDVNDRPRALSVILPPRSLRPQRAGAVGRAEQLPALSAPILQ